MARRKSSPSLALYRNIAVSFSAVTLLLVLTILYFSVARATIVVTPRVQSFPVNTSVAIVREPTSGSTALVGKVFSLELTKDGTFSASVVRDEDAKARGPVRIVNTTGSPQTLVASTRFVTQDNILFRLQKTVVVPAKGSATETIVADVAGASGEVTPTRWTIPGLRKEQQSQIYGETDAAMTGGRRSIARIRQEDVDAARAALTKQIEEEVRKEIEVEAADRLFFITSFTPITSKLDKKLGEETNAFSLALTGRIDGVAVSERALHDWLTAQLKTILPDDQRLLPIGLDAVRITIATQNPKEGTARLLVEAQGRSLLRNTSPVFDRTRFVGRTKEEVTTLLKNHGGITDVQVKTNGLFTKRLPRLPDHIQVEIREP